MSKICRYSVLRYVPEQHREEFINIGLVFHSPEDRYVNIQFTTNFSRVRKFDDELDTNFLKVILRGLESEFTLSSTISGPSESDLADRKFLDKSTMFYVNQLQFSKVKSIISSNYLKDEEDLFKTFVYFDAHKEKRITRQRVKSLLSKVFSENERQFQYQKDLEIKLDNDDINVDFVFKKPTRTGTKNNILNSLSFDYAPSQEKNALTLAKEWHWNINKMQDLQKQNKYINKYIDSESDLDFTTIVLQSKKTKSLEHASEILADVSNIITVDTEDEVIKAANEIVRKTVKN